MSKKVCMKTELPECTGKVLQGLAYWIGYREQYFDAHSINEGEIVGEALKLFAAKSDMRVNAEVMYKTLCSKWSSKKERADIVLSFEPENKEDFDYKRDVRNVFEVKRRGASYAEIKKDLKKLAKFLSLKNDENVRAFLLYVSPNKLPKKFVAKDGRAIRGDIGIPETDEYVGRARQVKKSLSTFYRYRKGANNTKKKTLEIARNANYACLIEVVKKCKKKP